MANGLKKKKKDININFCFCTAFSSFLLQKLLLPNKPCYKVLEFVRKYPLCVFTSFTCFLFSVLRYKSQKNHSMHMFSIDCSEFSSYYLKRIQPLLTCLLTVLANRAIPHSAPKCNQTMNQFTNQIGFRQWIQVLSKSFPSSLIPVFC